MHGAPRSRDVASSMLCQRLMPGLPQWTSGETESAFRSHAYGRGPGVLRADVLVSFAATTHGLNILTPLYVLRTHGLAPLHRESRLAPDLCTAVSKRAMSSCISYDTCSGRCMHAAAAGRIRSAQSIMQ